MWTSYPKDISLLTKDYFPALFKEDDPCLDADDVSSPISHQISDTISHQISDTRNSIVMFRMRRLKLQFSSLGH